MHFSWYRLHPLVLLVVVVASIASSAQRIPVSEAVVNSVTLSRLPASNAQPFHLKASARPANSFIPDYEAEIEEFWMAPDKWRLTIRAKSFDRTVIVNGSHTYERDSSEYYPEWLNDIVVAVTDVVPEQLVGELRGLPDTVALGTEASIQYRPSSTDGKVTSTWGGRIEFAQPGVLSWISGKTFSASFRNYTYFHDKYVAQTVETFPQVPHGDVETHVEVSDYSPVDESLFAIDKPTPAEDQIRVVSIEEPEYRKTATYVPEMKWAPVQRRPTSGVLSLRIFTDKAGVVREARLITSGNMELQDSAEELVRQWRFKPMKVNGVPVEVRSTMTFAFDTKIEGAQAKYQPASYYFKRGRDLNYPRTDGSPAFHLTGTFSWEQGSATQRGEYEEFWAAPNRWRREVTVRGMKAIETRLDDDHYVLPTAPDLEPIVARAVSLFTAEFPGYAYYSPDTDWQMDEITCSDQPCLRVSMGPTENMPEGRYPRAYYFNSAGFVLARSQSKEMISYGGFQVWAGKQVPRLSTLKVGKQVAFTANVENIEPGTELDDRFFKIPAVKPKDWIRPPPW